VAAKDAEYAVPTEPPESEEVVIETGGIEAKMLTVNDWVALSFSEDESATFTVNVKDPLVVGVPESFPPGLKLRPVGKLPEAILQEYGVWPPDAANVVE
jgi:hypothetical protein